MSASNVTVQELLDAIAELIEGIDGILYASARELAQIQKFPTALVRWFSDIDTTVDHGSTQKWNPQARITLYMAPVVGNPPGGPVVKTNNLIHKIVDTVSVHPQHYPAGSQIASLGGVDRCQINRVRPAEFGLEYAGHKYFGAELFLDIKLHREVAY